MIQLKYSSCRIHLNSMSSVFIVDLLYLFKNIKKIKFFKANTKRKIKMKRKENQKIKFVKIREKKN